MSDRPIDMSGPWQAVALDCDGFVIDPPDADAMTDCVAVTVVRRTAAPAPQTPGDTDDTIHRAPETYDPDDELYCRDDLEETPQRAPLILAQAQAVADALNQQHRAA